MSIFSQINGDFISYQTAQSLVPLHVVVFESLSLFSLEKYKELATASQGRCVC